MAAKKNYPFPKKTPSVTPFMAAHEDDNADKMSHGKVFVLKQTIGFFATTKIFYYPPTTK